jgi:hypothetical protein
MSAVWFWAKMGQSSGPNRFRNPSPVSLYQREGQEQLITFVKAGQASRLPPGTIVKGANSFDYTVRVYSFKFP